MQNNTFYLLNRALKGITNNCKDISFIVTSLSTIQLSVLLYPKIKTVTCDILLSLFDNTCRSRKWSCCWYYNRKRQLTRNSWLSFCKLYVCMVLTWSFLLGWWGVIVLSPCLQDENNGSISLSEDHFAEGDAHQFTNPTASVQELDKSMQYDFTDEQVEYLIRTKLLIAVFLYLLFDYTRTWDPLAWELLVFSFFKKCFLSWFWEFLSTLLGCSGLSWGICFLEI